jgi:hypothetical protein
VVPEQVLMVDSHTYTSHNPGLLETTFLVPFLWLVQGSVEWSAQQHPVARVGQRGLLPTTTSQAHHLLHCGTDTHLHSTHGQGKLGQQVV